ncbi:phage holin family protein [Actinomyces sp. B33]|nr:phage holin family protein [Actinomyces sp. B33]MDC4232333.1 phage holin family protein [Actinomyces sp. B33]
MDFIVRLIATMAGLWVCALLVPSISIPQGTDLTTTLLTLAGLALVFTLVNSIIKPIVKTLALPLYVLTFGVFALVTNALMFMLTGWLAGAIGLPFETGGFWSCFIGAIITAVISSLVAGLIGAAKD